MKFTEYTPSEQYAASNQWLQLKEGDNKVRIVSEFETKRSHFMGRGVAPMPCIGEACTRCAMTKEFYANPENDKKPNPYKPTVQYLMWAINRADGEIQILTIGTRVMNTLAEYASDEDYKFDPITGLPGYDITIKKTVTGSLPSDTAYSVLPRAKTPLTKEELAKIKELTPIRDILEKANSKRMQEEVKEVFSDDAAGKEPEEVPAQSEELEDLPF